MFAMMHAYMMYHFYFLTAAWKQTENLS